MENVEQKNVEIALMMGLPTTDPQFDTDWNWLMQARDFLVEHWHYVEMTNDTVKIIDLTTRHKIVVFEYSCLRLNLFEAIYQYSQWKKQN